MALPVGKLSGWAVALALLAWATTAGAQAGYVHVPHKAALQATAVSLYPHGVWRDGYAAAGDAPPVFYLGQTGPCSLGTAAAGDGGSQVKSADGGCWMAVFPATGMDVREFGALCKNGADDTAAINAALSVAPAQGKVIIPPNGVGCGFSGEIIVPSGVTLDGVSAGRLLQITKNIPIGILLNGTLAGLKNLFIAANNAGTDTSGTTVVFAPGEAAFIDNVIIEGPCIGVEMHGATPRIINSEINDVQGPGCGAITIGPGDSGGYPVDARAVWVTVGGAAGSTNPADFGIRILSGGGVELIHDDIIYTKYGLWVDPGAGQEVDWLTCSASDFDTNATDGIVIMPSSATGIVKGTSFDQCWSSSSVHDEVVINANGGTVQGVHFVGQRAYGCGTNCFNISAGTDISIDSSYLCGYPTAGGGGNGVVVGAGVGNLAIRGNEIKPGIGTGQISCDHIPSGSGPTNGILINGVPNGPTGMIITDNDLRQNATPIAGYPGSSGPSYIRGNLGVDDSLPSVTAAATITLNGSAPVWGISGATAINTINGFWPGRQVTLVEVSGQSVNLGPTGNVCNAVTLPAYGQVIAIYVAGLVCWSMR